MVIGHEYLHGNEPSEVYLKLAGYLNLSYAIDNF